MSLLFTKKNIAAKARVFPALPSAQWQTYSSMLIFLRQWNIFPCLVPSLRSSFWEVLFFETISLLGRSLFNSLRASLFPYSFDSQLLLDQHVTKKAECSQLWYEKKAFLKAYFSNFAFGSFYRSITNRICFLKWAELLNT